MTDKGEKGLSFILNMRKKVYIKPTGRAYPVYLETNLLGDSVIEEQSSIRSAGQANGGEYNFEDYSADEAGWYDFD